MRLSALPRAIAALLLLAPPLAAQDAGPLALLLPGSARAAALGNAAVASRDDYAIFANPAQMTASNGFAVTLAGYGSNARGAAAASAATVGPVTLGWGVQFVDFTTLRGDRTYPLAPGTLGSAGDADNMTLMGVVAGNFTWKNFRLGVAGKYAEDVVPRESATSSLLVTPARGAAWLADLGASHALWTGTAAIALQNIGQPYALRTAYESVPTQLALGWATQRSWGPFDYGFTTQVAARRQGWIAPAAGVEMGWSWIEGFSVTARAGAHRTETAAEHPMTAGFGFTADRLSVDWGANFFDNGKLGHRVTVRWR